MAQPGSRCGMLYRVGYVLEYRLPLRVQVVLDAVGALVEPFRFVHVRGRVVRRLHLLVRGHVGRIAHADAVGARLVQNLLRLVLPCRKVLVGRVAALLCRLAFLRGAVCADACGNKTTDTACDSVNHFQTPCILIRNMNKTAYFAHVTPLTSSPYSAKPMFSLVPTSTEK
ncbi:MAG: hypothetical protein IKB97_05740 [Bacteroidaceae bacterium]|nr:hypothetical protein [Bacteroidaceae bacterium]